MTQNTRVIVAPSIAPTIVITCLFGIFGLIPASMAASKAKALGLDAQKYWNAFLIPMGIFIVLAILIAAGS